MSLDCRTYSKSYTSYKAFIYRLVEISWAGQWSLTLNLFTSQFQKWSSQSLKLMIREYFYTNKHHPKFCHIFLIDYNSQYPWKIIQNLFKFFHVWGFKSTSQCWKMNFLHLIESFEESLMLDWMKLHLKLFWIWFHSYLHRSM